MKINGEKLRIARHLSGYSITDLAKILGISKQSLSQYENGTEIKPDIYFKLLNILKCDKEFLEVPFKNEVNINNTFFRASASANATEKKCQETKTTILAQIYILLLNHLNLPKLNLPHLDKSLSIEEKANYLRKFWGLNDKPIQNMIKCLENNGIIVSTFNSSDNESSNKIDGYTQQFSSIIEGKINKLYCVIVENDKRSLARKNFSLAHELGHIILHSDDYYMEKTKTEQTIIEKQANDFAAAFLLPKQSYYNDAKYINNLDNFIKLKQKWYVSIGAMMMRSRDLGCINNQEYLRLIKNYSYRRYKKEEPLDDIFITYKPQLFKQSFDLLFRNGYTIEKLKEELIENGLSLSLEQLEDILGLEEGFFNRYDVENDVITINIKDYYH